MADDIPYTKREQDNFINSVNTRFDTLDKTLERIEGQTSPITIWSGEARAAIEQLLKDTAALKKDRTRIYTVISVLIVVGATVGFLFYNLIDLKIQTDENTKIPPAVAAGIDDYFSAHFSKTEIINNSN